MIVDPFVYAEWGASLDVMSLRNARAVFGYRSIVEIGARLLTLVCARFLLLRLVCLCSALLLKRYLFAVLSLQYLRCLLSKVLS